MTRPFRARFTAVHLIIVALSLAWFVSTGLRPLTHPDEGRYAEIPREMLSSGDWVMPRLNALRYVEKPPLQYWATALSLRIFGTNEWAARLWPALTAYLTLWTTYALGRRLWDTERAVTAIAFLGSSVLFVVIGQTLTLDMSFSAFMTAALAAFCTAHTARERPRAQRNWMLGCWGALALAVLTKGIAALVIAGGTLALYTLWQRDWAVLKGLWLLPGLALFALIVVPWFVLAARADADFLRFFFIHEHFQRYLTRSADRYEPGWYFLVIAMLGTLPWLVPAVFALLRGWRASVPAGHFDVRRLLWTWSVFVMGFFSISDSKLAPYILPMFPALALLASEEFHRSSPRRFRSGSVIAGIAAGGLLAALIVISRRSPPPEWLAAVPDFRRFLLMAAGLLLAGSVMAWRYGSRSPGSRPVVAACLAMTLSTLVLLFGGWRSETLRSGKALAATIPAELIRSAPFYSVETYDQTVPFYIGRTLTLVNFRNELDYGLNHEPQRGIDTTAEFVERWKKLDQGVALMSNSTFGRLESAGIPMRLLGRDLRRVVVSRR